jgi:LysR family transcriptional regulator, nitrogen assimilation regulatory protein
VSFSKLATLPLILPNMLNSIRILVEKEAKKAKVSLRVAYEMEGSSLVLELVARGYGYTILPAFSVERNAHARKIQVNEIISPKLKRFVKMAMSKQRPTSLLVRETFALMNTCLTDAL